MLPGASWGRRERCKMIVSTKNGLMCWVKNALSLATLDGPQGHLGYVSTHGEHQPGPLIGAFWRCFGLVCTIVGKTWLAYSRHCDFCHFRPWYYYTFSFYMPCSIPL